ncbi:terminase small subunit [Tenacibaculum sp.]|uniref:terminase small subunit n=1 Tax=Tenacibaculum sp. TaxID=1906242 RepID=UPI003D096638
MTDKTFDKYCLVIDEWFVNGWNGTKAYQRFYPDSNNDVAAVEFNRILRIPKIEEYVRSKKETALESLKTSHQALLKELENWAYSDITETLELELSQVKDLPPEVRRLITSYKKSETRFGKDNENIKTTVELKFVSKERAMEMIHKHVGFYAEDNFQRIAEMTPEQRAKRLAELKEKLNKE